MKSRLTLYEIIGHYSNYFLDVFSAEEFAQFQRYLGGLSLAETRAVEEIKRLSIHEGPEQDNRNGLLLQNPFSIAALDRMRLSLLNSLPGTAFKPTGVLCINSTLLSYHEDRPKQITTTRNAFPERYGWAHHLVTLAYSDDAIDYPLHFALWQPTDLERIEQSLRTTKAPLQESKQELKRHDPAQWRQYLLGMWYRYRPKVTVDKPYPGKLGVAKQLLDEWVKAHPTLKLPVTLDIGYSQPDFCHYLDQKLKLPYVGVVARDAEIIVGRRRQRVDLFSHQLKTDHWRATQSNGKPVFQPITVQHKGKNEVYYSYCATHELHHYGKVRLVINHRCADLSDKPVFLISNQLQWKALALTQVRAHRYSSLDLIDIFPRENKPKGVEPGQLQEFAALQRHVAFVAVLCSLQRAAQHDPVLQTMLPYGRKLAKETMDRIMMT
jgi:hypothetical protein